MKTKQENEFLRVAAQFTIRRNIIGLLSEEDNKSFKKGSLVMQINRNKLNDMTRPLTIKIVRKTEKGIEKIITKPVLK